MTAHSRTVTSSASLTPRNAAFGLGVIAIAMASSAVASAQVTYGLQQMNSIDLGSQFFGTAAGSSAYGSSPSSIAFDGTNVYIGGRNDPVTGGNTGTSTVGVVQVQNALTGNTAFNGLASTQTSIPTGRGLDSLTYNGDSLYIGAETGSVTDSYIRRYVVNDPAGAGNFTATNPFSGLRVGYIATDPVGSSTNGPLIGGVTFSGSGRRLAVDPATGALVYGPTGSPTPGFIINSVNTVYRSVAFDAAGDIIAGDDNTVTVGVRTGANSIQQVNSTSAGGTVVLSSNVTVNNVGRGVSFLENATGTGTTPLIVASLRAGATATVPVLSETVTDSTGATTTIDPRTIIIRNRDGTVLNPATANGFSSGVITGAEDGLANAYTGDIKNFATGTLPDGTPVLLVVNLIERRLDVYSLEPTWQNAAGGTWSSGANWVRGRVADGSVNNAKFGNAITSNTTVTLDAARTVKNLKFDNASAAYTINGTATLTLAAPVNNGVALPAYVTVASGSHTVNAPIVLGSNTRFDVTNAASTLTLGNVDGSGQGLTKRGAGKVAATHVRVSSLAVNEGTLAIKLNGTESGISRTGALTLGTNPTNGTPTVGTLDLGDNGLIVDYGDSSPFATLDAAIAGGTITTSALLTGRTIGIIDYGVSTTTPLPTFTQPGLAIDNSSVFIRYTFKGDTNLDRDVDFDDLLALAKNYNKTSGALYTQGDTDRDGDVDFDDLLGLAKNYNQTLAPLGADVGSAAFQSDWALAQSLVPEPTAIAGLLGAGIALSRRNRRRA